MALRLISTVPPLLRTQPLQTQAMRQSVDERSVTDALHASSDAPFT